MICLFYSVQLCLSVLCDHYYARLYAVFTLKMGAFQSAELSYHMREASYGCWSIVPFSLPSCLPHLRSHTGAPSHPSREEFTQTSKCSDRRALVCYSRAAVARKGRQAVREAGGSAGKRAASKEKRGAREWALHTPIGPLGVSRQACVCCVSQQGHTVIHVGGPSRHKQMFSGYCCSASPVIVFL